MSTRVAGGLVGQAIYGLVPVRYASQSNAGVVIALDSSGSMRMGLFFGNDPWGRRRKAAKKLVDRLSPGDRVAIIDFDDDAEVLLKLVPLSSPQARQRARKAIAAVGYADPTLAMARAYETGDYTLREIAGHFGVPASSVKRAVDQHRGGRSAAGNVSTK